MPSMRLQKYLAQAGILSRREAELAISNGWIMVNGIPAVVGQPIDPDTDQVDWSQVLSRTNPGVIAFHKPRGVVTNCPVDAEIDIQQLLPSEYRSFSSIGRLDKESEGLILLTNSGVIAKQALRQDNPHWREYLVWTNRPITTDCVSELEAGMVILAMKVRPVQIDLLGERYCKIRMNEGKNRQIRRMMQKVGLGVVRLKRIAFGPIFLDNLSKGKYRKLTNKEVRLLEGEAGYPGG